MTAAERRRIEAALEHLENCRWQGCPNLRRLLVGDEAAA